MDSHQLLRFGISRAYSSYNFSQSSPQSMPNRLFESPNVRSRDSPISPFSTPFNCDPTVILSDSQEHHSSTGSLSAQSSSSNSPLETSSYYNQFNSSPVGESPQGSSPENLFQQAAVNKVSIEHALQELETALMSTDCEENEATVSIPSMGEPHQPQVPSQRSRFWNRDPQGSRPAEVHSSLRRLGDEAQSEKRLKAVEEPIRPSAPPGNLKQLLIECARALSENRIEDFEKLVEQAKGMVSISGDPIQRLGAYLIEGLVARKESSGTKIYRALRCKEPLGQDLLSYMHILYEICPYLKFGYMVANGAIAEACRDEDHIHIVDYQIGQGTQWMTLLQALATKPGRPPTVRITGIDDPVSRHARGACLEAVGKRLAVLSEKFNMPIEFQAVPVYASEVTQEMLDVRPGWALAVNFPLQLHHTPDESVDVNNPRDGLLRMVKSLGPKVVTLVEQESNTNTTPLLTRFIETLDFYSAMFESIDVTMPRDRKERINVEQHCLAKDIVNIIACEGKDRVERHELFGKWKSRFTMAGFQQSPLSSYVNSVIKGLLRCYSEYYTLVEKDGALLLGWKDRMLVSASAWH